MGYAAGDTIKTYHKVVDTNGDPVTGLDETDFSILLGKDGGAFLSPVTVTETALPAVYEFAFTTDTPNGGTYVLVLQELTTFPNSAETVVEREWRVGGVGEDFEPSYANAWCSQADIERYAGETYTPNRTPSDVQIKGFAEEIASRLTAVMREAGFIATPSGGSLPLDVSTQDGKDLQNLLRQANAIGAASRAKRAAFLGQPPSDSPVPDILWGMFLDLAGGFDPVKRVEVDGAIPKFVLATQQIIEGTAGISLQDTAGLPLPFTMEFQN